MGIPFSLPILPFTHPTSVADEKLPLTSNFPPNPLPCPPTFALYVAAASAFGNLVT
jgi:hypothetical protein